MSADSWCKCPLCGIDSKKILDEKYGKIPMEEYEELRKKIQNESIEETVSIYRSVYIKGDKMICDALGSCSKCGAKWRIKTQVEATFSKEK